MGLLDKLGHPPGEVIPFRGNLLPDPLLHVRSIVYLYAFAFAFVLPTATYQAYGPIMPNLMVFEAHQTSH